jgi:hypothetical protein
MKKVRIVKKVFGGVVSYVIQTRHWLFRWKWADAWESSMNGADCVDSFSTYEEALDNVKYFDGSKGSKEK